MPERSKGAQCTKKESRHDQTTLSSSLTMSWGEESMYQQQQIGGPLRQGSSREVMLVDVLATWWLYLDVFSGSTTIRR